MGVKRKGYVHYESKSKILDNTVCSNCVSCILANKDEHITLGIGNINADVILVLPNYDANAKQGYITILSKLIEEFNIRFDKNLLDYVYITRVVKCYNKKINFDLFNESIKHCANFLNYELNRLTAKTVLFFGDTHDIVYPYIRYNGYIRKRIRTTYSPGVLFFDNKEYKDKLLNDIKQLIVDL